MLKGRRHELDGLRAVAVLMVFATHTGYNLGPGYLGVNVFFVLSGFLITSLLIRERERTGRVDLPAFYMRRALRLYPALVAACGFVLVLAAVNPVEPFTKTLRYAAVALAYLMDFLVPAHHSGDWLPHTWSLGVEEQFYLLWPAALLLLARRGWLMRGTVIATAGTAVGAGVAASVLGGTAVQYSPIGPSYQLLAGALLAVVVARRSVRVPRAAWVPAVVIYVAMWVGRTDPRYPTLERGPMQLFTVAVLLAVVWAMQYQPWVLTNAAARWLGERSYGFYLYHLPLVALIPRELHRRTPGVVLAFVAALLVTELSWRYVEQPFLRLKDRRAQVMRARRVQVPLTESS